MIEVRDRWSEVGEQGSDIGNRIKSIRMSLIYCEFYVI